MLQDDYISGVSHSIDKDMVRESIRKMRNGKVVGSSGLVSEIVKVVAEAVNIIKIIAEG